MSELIIETNKLSKSFTDVWAVYGLDLRLNKNLTIGLVGPNGAGKTTLFSLLCGFLKPTKGSIKILGQNPDHPSIRGKISILPQDALMLTTIPVGRQLKMLAQLQGFDTESANEESDKVLKMVELFDVRHKTLDQMSHGMRKRVSIAQAFIGTPELILLDEPTAGLDPNTTENIKSVIRSLRSKCTMIISSHNIEVIEDLCDEVIILQKGRLNSHEKVADLTVRTKALTFRLEQDLDVSVKDVLMAIDCVTDVKLGDKGQHRMVIYFRDDKDTPAEIEIMQALVKEKIPYREMIRGERLRESVADKLS
jgi:ABC-2 type transport system ATP-binding protein